MRLVLPRYLVREISLHLLGVLVVVVAVFLVQRGNELLGQAVDGAISGSATMRLLGLRTVLSLPSLVPVAFYLAVLLGLGRLYRDSEMTALAACGVGPMRVVWTVVALAVAVAATAAVLSFLVRPWAARRVDVVEEDARRAVDLASLSPGRFYAIDSAGEYVLFAQKRTHDRKTPLEGILVQDRRNGPLEIYLSDRAAEENDANTGSRVLRLIGGTRYVFDEKENGVEITEYQELAIRTSPPSVDADERRLRSEDTAVLFTSGSSADRAELQWRLAAPISAFLLALVALPLARTDPRRGKYGRVMLALLIYIVYRQLLGAVKGWIVSGELGVLPGLWGVHALLIAGLAIFVFWRRSDLA